jgi:hypothetical protein
VQSEGKHEIDETWNALKFSIIIMNILAGACKKCINFAKKIQI